MTQASRGIERLWVIPKIRQVARGKDVGLDLVSKVKRCVIKPGCQFDFRAYEHNRLVLLNDIAPASGQAIGQFSIAGFKQRRIDGIVS